MDALRLLSRGTKAKRPATGATAHHTTPSAQDPKPQLFASSIASKKRKRGSTEPTETSGASDISFFGEKPALQSISHPVPSVDSSASDDEQASTRWKPRPSTTACRPLSERQSLLKEHKIKVSVLADSAANDPKSKKSLVRDSSKLFPDPVLSFAELTNHGSIPAWLKHNLAESGYVDTTEVQMAALDLQLSHDGRTHDDRDPSKSPTCWTDSDLLSVAPTGSGKTLAFLVPTLVRIAQDLSQGPDVSRCTRAIILAPTRELVDQIVNDGRRLSHNSGIRVAQFHKSMSRKQVKPRAATGDDDKTSDHPDVLVSTPGALHNAFGTAGDFTPHLQSVRYLVLDEADVLLDPMFREQTVGIWQQLGCDDLSVSLWSATMGSNIEDLARSIIRERRENLSAELGPIKQRSLIRLVVGLKDSAVPNVQHKLIYAATEQGKLMGLRQLLRPVSFTADTGPSLRPPFMIFTQTIERAKALHSELRYDIPAEAGGITRIAVLHSTLSDAAREDVMTRFRKGEVWILITTDLLSRGIDFRGVNGVVNYDIPPSSAAYVHRVGRTGRAGREGGIAVTLYSKEDIPYLKHVANVVVTAQRQTHPVDSSGVQKWLLDALPKLSKNEKQRFKKHGVEVRTAGGMAKDAKAARRARISTKAGYDRRAVNRKQQAIVASKRRSSRLVLDKDNEDDDTFAGFA